MFKLFHGGVSAVLRRQDEHDVGADLFHQRGGRDVLLYELCNWVDGKPRSGGWYLTGIMGDFILLISTRGIDDGFMGGEVGDALVHWGGRVDGGGNGVEFSDFLAGAPLHQGQVVADAVQRLQEEGAAAAHQLATVDDGDAVAEQVGLVHEVGGEDDGAALLVLDEQVPDGSAGVGVHSSGRLVQHHHPGNFWKWLSEVVTEEEPTLSLRRKRRRCWASSASRLTGSGSARAACEVFLDGKL